MSKKSYLSREQSVEFLVKQFSRCVPEGTAKKNALLAGVSPGKVMGYIEEARQELALGKNESILPGIRAGISETIGLVDDQIALAQSRGDHRQVARLLSTRRASLAELLKWHQVQQLSGLVAASDMDPREAATILAKTWGSSD